MKAIVTTNGTSTYRPLTEIAIKAVSDTASTEVEGDRIVALIGDADGGKPQKVYNFKSESEAEQILRSGNLLKAVKLAFRPSPDRNLRPAEVMVVNAQPNTQASYAFLDASSGTVFTLKTAKYGLRANQCRFTLTGSAAAGFSFTFYDEDLAYTSPTATKLGLALQISYSGAGSAATVTVTTVSSVKRLQTAVTGASGQNLDIPLYAGTKVRDVVAAINATGVYAASVQQDGDLDASLIDDAAALDIKTAAKLLTSTKPGLAYYFQNKIGPGLVEYTSGASVLAPVAVSAYFAGAAGGASIAADWQKAANALDAYDFAAIVPCTSTSALISGVRGVNQARNSAAVGRFSMLYQASITALPADSTSANVTTYIDGLEAEIATVNDSDTVVVASAMDITDPVTGLLRQAERWEVAVMLAGYKASVGPAVSLTYKPLPGSNAFPVMDTTSAKLSDRAVKVGALVLENVGTGQTTRIVMGRTSYVGEDNVTLEGELGNAVLKSIGRNAKAFQDDLIGQTPATKSLSQYQADLNSFYQRYADRGWLVRGRNAAGESRPPFSVSVLPTTDGGRHVISVAEINPLGEYLYGEHSLKATAVELEVQ
jgi:hypothetical protein